MNSHIGRCLRIAALSALVVLTLTASMPSADAAKGPKQMCTKSTRDFAKLPTPTAIADLGEGLRSIDLDAPLPFNLEPKTEIGKWDAYRLHTDHVNRAIGDLIDALGVGAEQHEPDAEAAHSALAQAELEMKAVDAALPSTKLPAECSSAAFGAAYLSEAAALINSVIPAPAGDFVTAATPPCNRLAHRASDAQDAHPSDILPSVDYAFASFQTDLATIPPPAGSEAQFTALKALVDSTTQMLDGLLLKYGQTLPKAPAKKLSKALKKLGPQFDAATKAVGLDC